MYLPRETAQTAKSTGKFPSRTNPCIKCALLNSACKMRLVVFEEWDTAQPVAETLSGLSLAEGKLARISD
jgi:hypothetical protein